jgi:hypothetical protein
MTKFNSTFKVDPFIIGRRLTGTGEMDLVWMDIINVYGSIPPLTPSDRDKP